ncbi:MAG: archease [Gemmatimonadota bacterium]|nr:archease [Gemmatimonadota bacterium]
MSELALRLRAPAFDALLAEAVRAVGGLLVAEAGAEGPGATRTIEVVAADREALLVDLLNELVFVAETERWAPQGIAAIEATGTRARLRLSGVRLAGTPSRIKGATFHGLTVQASGGQVEAEVILDV